MAVVSFISYVKSQNTLKKDNPNSNFQWQNMILFFVVKIGFIKEKVCVSDTVIVTVCKKKVML